MPHLKKPIKKYFQDCLCLLLVGIDIAADVMLMACNGVGITSKEKRLLLMPVGQSQEQQRVSAINSQE